MERVSVGPVFEPLLLFARHHGYRPEGLVEIINDIARRSATGTN
ncbi:MAG TPA: hypothetical protein VIU11_06625 [Nakamurella sp.]